MMNERDPLLLFISAFVISATAALAALLRSNRELTIRLIAAVTLNGGIMGLGIALLLFTYFRDNAYFLVGLCLFAGLGGLTFLGFILQLLRQGGVNINVHVEHEESHDVQDQV